MQQKSYAKHNVALRYFVAKATLELEKEYCDIEIPQLSAILSSAPRLY